MGIDHKGFFFLEKKTTPAIKVLRDSMLCWGLVCVHFIRVGVEVKFDERPCGTAVFLSKEKD